MEEYYEVDKLNEASYLNCLGFNIIKTKTKEGSQKRIICFSEPEKCKKAILDFHNGGMVVARKLFESHRAMKDLIFKTN